ncbi:hypothetical protein MTO96_036933 [Rhipicephalus appendiculatus]
MWQRKAPLVSWDRRCTEASIARLVAGAASTGWSVRCVGGSGGALRCRRGRGAARKRRQIAFRGRPSWPRTHDAVPSEITRSGALVEDEARAEGDDVRTRPPRVVTPPENTRNRTGGRAAMTCEALPTDSSRISVQSRGGPDSFEVTSWLQLLDLRPEDTATYWCVGANENGETSAAAKLNVLP